jgi:TolB-like protein
VTAAPGPAETPFAFISYASADRALAETLTDYLERHGARCWIAPRDVPPGALYADAIVRAISDAQALVLLLSRSSIASSHVGKELERASSKRRPIIALRLDDGELTPAFEYFLSESQWIDLRAAGREAAFARLAQVLAQPAAATSFAPPAVARSPRPGRRNWLLAAAALILVGAAAAGLWKYVGSKAQPAPAAASVAVLPFADMSEAHDQGYFADGMAEQILDLLAKIPHLKVIARTSSFQFKGKDEDVRLIGEKLGVATVLEGSVRKAGNRLRITAQLIRAADGSHLWSEVYDREMQDVFRMQDEIAGSVVSALRVSLLGAPAPRPAPTNNTEAYTLFLQGVGYWQRYTTADSARARDCFQRAVALDPNFAEAWAYLANASTSAALFGGDEPWEKVRARISAAAQRALQLDPSLADAHVALSSVAFLDGDVAGSQREVDTALRLEPENMAALDQSLFISVARGRLAEAVDFAHRLIERDPLAIDPYRALATALWFDGRAQEAEAVYRRTLALHPSAESLHARLAMILLSDRQPQAALAELKLEPNAIWQLIGQIMALDALGRRPEADALLAKLEPQALNGWQYQVAQIYALRQDRDRAFLWLERAHAVHDPGLVNYLKCDPLLKDVRGDPRYTALLAQLNLPP